VNVPSPPARAAALVAAVLVSGCHSSATPLDPGSGSATPTLPSSAASPASAAATASAPTVTTSSPSSPSSTTVTAPPRAPGSPIDFSAMNAALAGKKPLPSCAPIGKGVRYDIGSTRTPSLDDVPWTSLAPGDVVCVPYRPQPYRAKIYFVTRGAAGAPIRLVGLRGPHGERPIIDGDGATTSHLILPEANDRMLEEFGVISFLAHFIAPPGSPWGWHPGWITVSGLEIQHARPGSKFVDGTGKSRSYAAFTAGIYINPGDDLVIEDCEITDSQVGIFAKSSERIKGHLDRTTERLTLRGNYIHDNGDPKMLGIHNVYLEGRGCNVIGNVMIHKAGNVGSNYKSRCGHERIYGNRIDGGAQSFLMLIDPQSGWSGIGTAADYEPTVVAGNLLVNGPNGAVGSPLVAFGGDSYTDADHYRRNLIFYANTVLGRTHGGMRIPVIGTGHLTKEAPSITAWMSSNLIDNAGDGATGAPLLLSLATGAGRVVLDHSFVDPTVTPHDQYDRSHGTITGFAPSAPGASPGIAAGVAEPRPLKGSPLIDAGAAFASLPAGSGASTVTDFALYEPSGTIEDPWYRARAVNGPVDIGAYESAP
jgi:hypothetical protein